MNIKNLSRGFTLIELLVVIAIIGILAGVIIPSLNTAREKGKIAAFKSEMDSFRKQAEVYNNEGNTYVGLFNSATPPIVDNTATDPLIERILVSLMEKSADGKIYGSTSQDGYALYGRIPATTTDSLLASQIWCTDNKGKSGNPSVDATTQFTDTDVTECW